MECPRCHQSMTKSAAGWLCLNCGHVVIGGMHSAQKARAGRRPEPKASISAAHPKVAVAAAVPLAEPVKDQTAAPLVREETLAPLPKLRKNRAAKMLFLLSFLMAAGSGLFIAKMFFYDPAFALAAYMDKLSARPAASIKVSGKLTSGHDLAGALGGETKFNAEGAYDLTEGGKPKADLRFKLDAPKNGAEGRVVSLPSDFYFRFDNAALPKLMGMKPLSGWNRVPWEDAAALDPCRRTGKQFSFEYAAQALKDGFPVKNSKRVGLYRTINGHETEHFTGQIDSAGLQRVIKNANQALPKECRLPQDEKLLSGTVVDYELWNGDDFDRLYLKFRNEAAKTQGEVTIDTSGYGKELKVSKPDNSKPAGSVGIDEGQRVQPAPSPAPTPKPVSPAPAAAADPAVARDSQRKANLRDMRTALEGYAGKNGRYPTSDYSGLKALLGPYIKNPPNDPLAGKTYRYVPSKCSGGGCSAYRLEAALERANDPDATGGLYVLTGAR